MNDATRPLRRERFIEILEAYGADPERWPAHEREAALALLAADASARALRDRAARLDCILAAAEDATPSAALVDRIAAAVPAPAAAAEARRPASHARAPHVRRVGSGRRALRYLSAGFPVAAAAALALWLVRTPEQSAPTLEAIAALGTYETPGDELLTTSEVDLFEDPWLDCADTALGCLDDDVDDGEPRSEAANQVRIRS